MTSRQQSSFRDKKRLAFISIKITQNKLMLNESNCFSDLNLLIEAYLI